MQSSSRCPKDLGKLVVTFNFRFVAVESICPQAQLLQLCNTRLIIVTVTVSFLQLIVNELSSAGHLARHRTRSLHPHHRTPEPLTLHWHTYLHLHRPPSLHLHILYPTSLHLYRPPSLHPPLLHLHRPLSLYPNTPHWLPRSHEKIRYSLASIYLNKCLFNLNR